MQVATALGDVGAPEEEEVSASSTPTFAEASAHGKMVLQIPGNIWVFPWGAGPRPGPSVRVPGLLVWKAGWLGHPPVPCLVDPPPPSFSSHMSGSLGQEHEDGVGSCKCSVLTLIWVSCNRKGSS